MSSVHGQASAEYAGLIGLAVVIGAALALIAGPPLVSAIRHVLVSALSGSASRSASVTATAADIADVHATLLPPGQSVTPDAALLALERRHGSDGAAELAATVLLDVARVAAPWIGRPRTYRAWLRVGDNPYQVAAPTNGDRDVEAPTTSPEVRWVTVADQRRALTAAFAHHTSVAAVVLDAVSAFPPARLLRAARAGTRLGGTAARALLRTADGTRTGSEVVELVNLDGGDIPAGIRAGDVVVKWRVHRTFWRAGQADPEPVVPVGKGGYLLTDHDYWHLVFLRPAGAGLAVVAEGIHP